MLQIAEQKRARMGVANVEFRHADAQQLPFEDDHFQIVSVAFGLRNIEDTARGLAEMVRVCMPGGKVAVLEFTTPRRQPIRGLYQWYFKYVLPRIGQALARNDSRAYNYLPQSVGEFPSYEHLTQAMVEAGLRQADYYPLTFGIATLYIGIK
jgi:demethylmenaquinone methyltransferase/2-methoxy-6-polyprenyl-1,4-benzoquinol methylase